MKKLHFNYLVSLCDALNACVTLILNKIFCLLDLRFNYLYRKSPYLILNDDSYQSFITR